MPSQHVLTQEEWVAAMAKRAIDRIRSELYLEISAVDALCFRQQGKRGTQPVQRNAAECFFAFAHARLGERRVILRKAEHAAVKALAVAVTLALNAVVKNMGGGVEAKVFFPEYCDFLGETTPAHIF